MAARTESVRFQQALAPLQGIVVQDLSPLNGKIVQVMFHFPAGCNALVDVAFGKQTKQIFPSNSGFLALNDATPIFECDEDIKRETVLWCQMQNTDAVNPHTITVLAVIVGE